jgi:hypothetical protein
LSWSRLRRCLGVEWADGGKAEKAENVDMSHKRMSA